ncbi:MAG: hypothetical protein JKY67_13720 [Pseudomonadales bacterium]|nr:hypothetical protein [Pseudomonadales bacterium]
MLLNIQWKQLGGIWSNVIFVLCLMALVMPVEAADSYMLGDNLELAPFKPMVISGALKSKKLNEVSGIAPSRNMDDRYWVLNDGGNPERLYLIDSTGALKLSVKIKGVVNRDWEDLSSFILDGVSYLLIADVGDNRSKRHDIALHVFKEPNIVEHSLFGSSEAPQAQPPRTISLSPIATIKLRFEDGPRDCEAVAVDAKRKRVLLISKRTKPPVLYEAPLRLTSTVGSVVVRRIAEINHIPNPTIEDMRERPIVGVYGAQPTAMDINEDGSEMLLLTYKQAYIYSNDSDSWRLAVTRLPKKISFPLMEQAESASYSRDGSGVIIVSENVGTPVFLFSRSVSSVP